MSELSLVKKGGGGAKAYTESDCSIVQGVTATITLPTGVSWDAIDTFVISGTANKSGVDFTWWAYKSKTPGSNLGRFCGYGPSREWFSYQITQNHIAFSVYADFAGYSISIQALSIVL